LLFDHGCDAINASLLAICMGSVFATGWTTKIFLGYFIGFVPFYYQTWEEYYTGTMVLPAFNGPSEGLVVIAIFSFISAILGSQFWQTVSNLTSCRLILLLLICWF
jgi:ethanolaminephosphotransferase